LGCLFFLPKGVLAATYYISNTDGNDANCTGLSTSAYVSGTGQSCPFQTLTKVNTLTLAPGDNILFKRGDTFYGSITVSQSGTAGNPITFSSYGFGAQPVITGFTAVTAWTNLGNNIWESTNPVSTLPTVNMVTVNNVNTEMGRYPNADAANGGYLKVDSTSTSTSLTSSSLTGSPDWTGAEVVVRSGHFLMGRSTITSQASSTINFNPMFQGGPEVDFGFFIQNDPRTLDQQNEWYYNPTDHKLQIYSVGQPTNVNVASVTKLITIQANYLTFDDLDFTGANELAFYAWDHTPRYNNVSITNSSFLDMGVSAIYTLINYLDIENNTISESNGSAMSVTYGTNVTIKNNDIRNIGLKKGMKTNIYSGNNNSAVESSISDTLDIESNTIVNTGYNAIAFYGNNILVKNNYIDTYCVILDDGGGIYTYTGPRTQMSNVKIIGNIVVNGHPDISMVPASTEIPLGIAPGIYLDERSRNVEVANNSVANTSHSGIFINSSAGYINVHDNTVYNASSYLLYSTYWGGTDIPPTNNQTNNNIFVAKSKDGPWNSSGQKDIFFYFANNDAGDIGTDLMKAANTLDNNYYARLIGDNDGKVIRFADPAWDPGFKTLAEWQAYSGQDLNSHQSAVSANSESDIEFEFNASSSDKTVNLTRPMVDVKGTKYVGSVVLSPYTSLVLVTDPNPDITPPTVTAFVISATSSSLTVPITLFTATDDSGVTGYLVTESSSTPLATDTGWATSTPANYTFSTQGSKTLYAWAKDAAGNVSASLNDSVNITLPPRTIPATFYISNTGSDSNNGTSSSTPWQTIDKVNASTFIPGDNILFKKGDTFYGSITISQSGTAGNPITFSSYGSGVQPVITGFTTVSSWTNLGNNIWESTDAVSTLDTVNMVTVNGVNTAMGRYPNADAAWGGYLPIQSHSGTTSLTNSSLAGTDWTGAGLVIRNSLYTIARSVINSQNGSTITFSSSTANFSDNYGFFIQNDPRTLDQQNEWYYSPTTHKIRIYSSSQPSNVKVASMDKLVKYNYNNYNQSLTSFITINGITFTGANESAIWGWSHLTPAPNNLDGIIINNCNISDIGNSGIDVHTDPSSSIPLNILNNNISETNGSAILVSNSGLVNIKNNNLTNISLTIGAGGEYGDVAISSYGTHDADIENNTISSCGFNGIGWAGNYINTVKNNFISNFNNKLSDGGAIGTGGVNAVGTSISGNIILNGYESGYGTPSGGLVVGIYLDDDSQNVEVFGNTIVNSAWIGIYLHNASYNNIHDNTVYNNGIQFRMVDDNISQAVTANNIINDNIFISKSASQAVADFTSVTNTLSLFGLFNNNYYARPMDDNLTISTWQPSTGLVNRSLLSWQNFSGQDLNSHSSPKSITSESDLDFEFATSSSNTVNLSKPMIDVTGTKYSNSVTLPAYTSLVLMPDTSDITPPTVTAFVISATSSSLTVPITLFAATDDIGVTSYLVTESSSTPLPTDTGWATSTPVNYTFSTQGSKTLYAWAKDAAGNVSASLNESVVITLSPITYTLSYTANANGTLTGSTTQTVNYNTNGTAVTAVPDDGYHFVSWSDSSTANPRTDTNVTSDMSVSATFDLTPVTPPSSGGGGGGGGGGYIAPVIPATPTSTQVVSSSTPSINNPLNSNNDSQDNNSSSGGSNSSSGSISETLAQATIEAKKIIAIEKKAVISISTTISTSLSGRLLLQVQNHGAAWYVNPANKLKYYLGTSDLAFSVMRKLGKGISNSDLKKIRIANANLDSGPDSDGDGLSDAFEDAIGSNKFKKDTDGDGYDDKTEVINGYDTNGKPKLVIDEKLARSLEGRILIQVQGHGEAWYISPATHLRYYLGRPDDAYSLMRSLSLGISNTNLRKIGVGEIK